MVAKIVADAISRQGVSPMSIDIATSDTSIVSTMLHIVFLRIVLISLLLVGCRASSAKLLCSHMLSIKAVAVIVNPVRVPAIVATVLYNE